MNAITPTRTNSPSFGMAAKLSQEVLDGIKHKPGSQVRRILGQVSQAHSASNAADCDVLFSIKQLAKTKSQGKSRKPLSKPVTKIIASVVSKSDNEIVGTPISIKLDKFGSFFSGFFGKIDKSINEVSKRQDDLVSISKFK